MEVKPGWSTPHESAHLHVAGEAAYVDDIPELAGTLYAAPGMSQRAHARINSINLDAVRCADGVVAVLTAEDIPGHNDCGPIINDDPILADGLVQYFGQPVFVVIAKSVIAARKAAKKAVIEYEDLPATLDVRQAKRAESWVLPPARLRRGDSQKGMSTASQRLSGEIS
ncbi:MAG: xanthine dehydrogenase molybdopterin binding subunit, partial [Gammaproteobacteria bacterium]|nr:xanthine dehydrogenase molybdopterin binding subunit [Gammaproteobacteria bacterium]